MNELVTDKELQEARLKGFTPGGAQVLGQLWWKELQKLTGAYGQLDVLHDFISAMFYTLQGQQDELPKLPCLAGANYEKRLTVMRRAMIFLGEAMERERFRDILGAADQELRGTKSQSGTGAFYTPDSVCDMMAALTHSESDPVKEKLERGEIVTVYDPTVGAGRTLLSFVAQHQKHIDLIRAFGTDIEINAVRMFYVNCALNGIAARCVHGNELSNDREWAVYYTPEWHIYEAKRREREQIQKWRMVFSTLCNAQEEPEAYKPDNCTGNKQNAQDGAAGREKMDVIVEKNGQLAFNF